MADLSPADRVVRKRNSNLQKQLDVTLQILGEEYRQAKDRMYKEERDCGLFLQSLYNRVPDLLTYGQPDTRAMNTNRMLKERRYSVSVSVLSDSDEEDSLPLRPPGAVDPESRVRAGGRHASQGPFGVSSLEAAAGHRAGKEGARAEQSGRGHHPARKTGGRTASRPSTAGPHRSGGRVHSAAATSAARQPDPQRAASAGLSQQRFSNPRYGKGAYSEHERCVQNKVLEKFHVIFDPQTEAQKVNLSSLATPVVVVQPDGNGTDCDTNSAHDHHGEQEMHTGRKEYGSRRVVWSAHPQRRPGVVSAPTSARVERPRSEGPGGTSRLQAPSLALLTSGAFTERGPVKPRRTPGRLDPKVQALALQRNLPVSSPEDLSDSSSLSEAGEEDGDVGTTSQRHQQTRSQAAQAKLQSPGESRQLTNGQHSEPRPVHTHVKPRRSKDIRVKLDPYDHVQIFTDTQLKPEPSNHAQLKPQLSHHVKAKRDPSNQLQVPGNATGLHPPGQGTNSATAARGKPSILRPSSRLSEASDVSTPPVELWSKLQQAGLPGRTRKRPKTAPSKSELSHRSMPAPRQTVVGILAQIENQKAHTRALLKNSKELQKAVKKLVPWEQTSDNDYDDW